ncbi:hypothetical protein [Vibrio eleionomae]|nr:hypothetical protein [Vibrio eleionomae]
MITIITRITFFLLLLFLSNQSYASSLGQRLFNTYQFDRAEKVLPELSSKGDADATFWLALVQFQNGKHFVAGDTMHKAAEQGNPWAMRMLVPKWNNYCDYLGWPCDSRWKQKAIDGWKILAKKNDGKAMYALLDVTYSIWKDIPFYRVYKYDKIVDKIVKNGGYNALNNRFVLSDSKRIELLKYAIKRNNPNAMVWIYYQCDDYGLKLSEGENCNDWLNTALDMGYYKAAQALRFYYSGFRGDKVVYKSIKPDEAFYYYSLGKLSGIDKFLFVFPSGKFSRNQQRKLDEIQAKYMKVGISEKAKKFFKNHKPRTFYDESSDVNDILKP